MLNFLLSLLIIALSSGLGVPEKVSQRISEALEAKVENNLNAPNQNADPQENIFGNLNLPDEIQNENAHQNSQQTTETNSYSFTLSYIYSLSSPALSTLYAFFR